MNKTFDIIVDSAANLTEEMIATTGIKMVPFTCIIDGTVTSCFESDKPFQNTAKAFYEKMAGGADIKTSLVSESAFIDAATPSLNEGKDVLIVTLSAGISGTYNQAVNAQKALKEQFPNNKVIVCDSVNASLGEGLLAVNAAKLRDMGESIDTCAEWLEENKYKMNAYVTVNDLKYLKKSGRISTTLAIAGTLLNIKPIIKADGGSPAKLTFSGKERGRKRALECIADKFTELADNVHQTVAITHCDCLEDAEKLAELVKERGASDVIIEYYDLCTGSHVGPGTLALFFMGNDRRANAAPAPRKKLKAKTVTQKI